MTTPDIVAEQSRRVCAELRCWAESGDFVDGEDPSLLIRAADEIERLRAQRDEAREMFDMELTTPGRVCTLLAQISLRAGEYERTIDVLRTRVAELEARP